MAKTLVDFVASLKQQVLADSGVRALIGDRFEPIPIDEGKAKPCASYAITGCVPNNTVDVGVEDGMLEVHFQVDAWAKTFGTALAVAEAIRIALQTVDFSPLPDEGEGNGVHLYEPETKLHRFHWRYTCQFST